MNFLDLKYFVITAEELNFTKAAKKLYITQQSLSGHIARLEKAYGVQLFHRDRPMRLTEEGKTLLISAKKILEDEREAVLRIQDIKQFKGGELTIGIPASRGTLLLPELLTQCKEKMPNVKMNLVEGTTAEITEALYLGKTDLILGKELMNPELLNTIYLRTEKSYIVVPDVYIQQVPEDVRNRLLASHQAKVTDFADCPFVLANGWLNDMFRAACQEGNIVPTIVLETRRIETALNLCLAGYGCTVVSAIFKMYLQQQPDAAAAVHCFEWNNPKTQWRFGISYLKGKYFSQTAKKFVRIAKELYQEK